MKLLFFLIVLFFGATLTSLAQVNIGQMAPEISLPNAMDSTINLSAFKNKVVLVDFWASWCHPCREENPEVIKLYKKYKKNGFEVFGVSLDANKKDWLNAIAQDKITYTQVDDVDGWNAAVAFTYGVNSIPSSFLLDQTGRVILIDATYSALNKKIKKLLK